MQGISYTFKKNVLYILGLSPIYPDFQLLNDVTLTVPDVKKVRGWWLWLCHYIQIDVITSQL